MMDMLGAVVLCMMFMYARGEIKVGRITTVGLVEAFPPFPPSFCSGLGMAAPEQFFSFTLQLLTSFFGRFCFAFFFVAFAIVGFSFVACFFFGDAVDDAFGCFFGCFVAKDGTSAAHDNANGSADLGCLDAQLDRGWDRYPSAWVCVVQWVVVGVVVWGVG